MCVCECECVRACMRACVCVVCVLCVHGILYQSTVHEEDAISGGVLSTELQPRCSHYLTPTV